MEYDREAIRKQLRNVQAGLDGNFPIYLKTLEPILDIMGYTKLREIPAPEEPVFEILDKGSADRPPNLRIREFYSRDFVPSGDVFIAGSPFDYVSYLPQKKTGMQGLRFEPVPGLDAEITKEIAQLARNALPAIDAEGYFSMGFMAVFVHDKGKYAYYPAVSLFMGQDVDATEVAAARIEQRPFKNREGKTILEAYSEKYPDRVKFDSEAVKELAKIGRLRLESI